MTTPDLIQQQRDIVCTIRNAFFQHTQALANLETVLSGDLARADVELKIARRHAEDRLATFLPLYERIKPKIIARNKKAFDNMELGPTDAVIADPIRSLDECTAQIKTVLKKYGVS